MRPDTKAIRARAEAFGTKSGSKIRFWESVHTDVPALCDRVEELEAALRGVLEILAAEPNKRVADISLMSWVEHQQRDFKADVHRNFVLPQLTKIADITRAALEGRQAADSAPGATKSTEAGGSEGSEDVVRITADEFDMRHRCDHLNSDGHRCLDGRGHPGRHDWSKHPWRGGVVDGKATNE